MKKRKEDFTYSLPLDTIVGGRYLIQEVCRVQGDQIVYLAADLVEKKQVELTEYFPQDLVTRDGTGGEENVTVLPGGQEQLQQQIRQFEREHDNTVKDHHTVYAVSEVRNGNKGKKPVGTIVLCIAVLLVGIVMGVSLFLPTMGEKSSDTSKTMYYGEEDANYILRPSEDIICVDETENVQYYDRMVVAFLRREPTEEEIATLLALVNGKLTGQIQGSVDYLQIELPESGFDKIQEAAKILMSNELVRYADYDYPVYIQPTMTGTDNNPWDKTKLSWMHLNANVQTIEYDEDNPSGHNWWAEAIGAYTAWNKEGDLTFTSITAGVIDSGFDMEHEDLISTVKTKTRTGEVVYSSPGITRVKGRQARRAKAKDARHGTGVAGIIGARNNSTGIRGVADNAQLLVSSWQVPYDAIASGEIIAMESEMIEQGAKVVNNSWTQAGALMNENSFNRSGDGINETYKEHCEMYEKLAERSGRDMALVIISLLENDYTQFMFVQSSGNGYQNTGSIGGFDSRYNGHFCSVVLVREDQELFDTYSYENIRSHIMIVGGVKADGKSYSVDTACNYGNDVDIYAPCRNVYTTRPKNKYGSADGTSFAAPMVTGAVALVWQIAPSLSENEVKTYLKENGHSLEISYPTGGSTAEILRPETLTDVPIMLHIGDAVTSLQEEISAGNVESRGQKAVDAYIEKMTEQQKEAKEKAEKADAEKTQTDSVKGSTSETAQKKNAEKQEKVPKDLFEAYLQSTLIPQYGLMSTDSWQLSTSLNTWEKGDDSPMDGILSALIRDLDDDGQDEMLVVRFTPGDKGRMYLEIYEANGQEVGLQDDMKFDTSDYCKYRWDARLTVFSREYQGETSLYLYAYDDSGNDFTNETIQQLKYRDNSLKISKYWQFQTGWDRSVWLESGTVKDADCNRRQLISWQEEGWYDESHIKEVLTQEKTLGSDENVDTSTAEYQEELNTLLAETYADLQSETGLTFKRCADTDMVNGMIAHTLIWSGRDLFYNHGEDDSTYVAALDNQYRDDVNTLVPFDYTEIVRK